MTEKKFRNWSSLIYLSASCFLFACATRTAGHRIANNSNSYFSNPVFEPILADPTVLKDPVSGVFYAYGTQDDWGDGKGSRLVPVLQSKDLTDWSVVGAAFERKPKWKKDGGLWAPEMVYDNGKYVMYYAYSTWGDANPGVGVATADKPEGPFTDHGKLFDSKSIDVPNSIDPFFWSENGVRYIFWGSFNDGPKQGTYGIRLKDNGLALSDRKDKFKIAAGDLEAVVIHKRKGYYYFIGSRGHCCDGVNSTYHMVVGRSKEIRGPYLDKNGKDLKERGNGTPLLKGNRSFVGVGHASRIIADIDGQDWILYHGIDVAQGKVSSGASRRMLLLDKIEWINDWPVINDGTPTIEPQLKPNFKKR